MLKFWKSTPLTVGLSFWTTVSMWRCNDATPDHAWWAGFCAACVGLTVHRLVVLAAADGAFRS